MCSPVRVRAMGIRDRPITPRSPWQNGYVERVIGSIRRDCLDHVVIFSASHLRRVLTAYADYYNSVRTHLGIAKDAPIHRPMQASRRHHKPLITRGIASSIRADLVFGRDN